MDVADAGRAIDRVAIARRLADVRRSYNVLGIALDRGRFADLGKLLSDEGIDPPMVKFFPGYRSYAPAVDALERAVLNKRMQHNGNPLMRWQAGNTIIETDAAGNRIPAKLKSLDSIDGIVTAIMACELAERDHWPKVYQGTGVARVQAGIWVLRLPLHHSVASQPLSVSLNVRP